MKHITGAKKDLILIGNLKSRNLRKFSVKNLWYLLRTFKNEKLTKINNRYVLNTFLPPFPSPSFEQFIKNTLAAKSRNIFPYSGYVALTGRCSFSCWHCSRAFRAKEELSKEDWIDVMRKLQALGISIIGYTGGEPLFRNDLEEIINSVTPSATTILFTTGEGLTSARAAELKRSGLFYVAVSLDHYKKDEHNRLRGSEKAFDTAVDAIKTSLAAGFYTAVQLAVRKDFLNKRDMDRYVEFVRSLGIHEIRIIEPMPTGILIEKNADVFLTDSERELIKEYHIKVNQDKNLPKIASFAYLEDDSLYGCGAGTQHLYIDSSGNLCPCDFTPLSFGNVIREGFDEAYSRLRKYFVAPQSKCFVLNNMEIIKSEFKGKLPLDCDGAIEVCGRCAKTDVPEFYRKLGWKRGG